MRKNLLFIGLALSMLAVGCNNDPVDDGNKKPNTGKKDVTVTVNATLPEGLTWAEGDVYLVNGVEAAALGAEVANAQTAQLVAVNLDSTSPIFVLGPAALRTGASEVTVGDVQKYVADGYDRSVRVLAGGAAEALPVEEGNKNNLTADVEMTTVQGIMTLPLTLDAASVSENPVAVEQITVTALGNEALNGVYAISVSIDKETGHAVATYKVNDATSVIDLVCEEPVELNAESAVDFNFVLPVGTYSGFEFVVTDTEARSYVFNVGEVAVEALAPTVLEQVAYKVVEKAPATLNVTIAESGVTWAEGDCIVCNNALSSEVATASVGTSTASFDFDAVAYPYSVFYPADLYSKTGSVRFSDEQTLIKGGFDRKNIVMVGYSATTDVEMKNLCGIITLPFKTIAGETLVVDNITVEAVNGESLAGKYHINYRNYTVTPVSPRTTVTLAPAEGETVELAPGEETQFSLVVPAGKYVSGLKLTIVTNLEVVETVVAATEGVDVRGGEVTTLPQYLYEEVKVPVITTGQEFADFVKAVNQGRYERFLNPETGEYILGGDIDLAGVTVQPGTGTFAGVFNGNGHKITNWIAAGPIFGKVVAPEVDAPVEGGEAVEPAAPVAGVKNVIIDASCQMVSTVSGGKYGFIAGECSVPVVDCVNNANINLNVALENSLLYVGGLFGELNGGVTASNCNNYGKITVTLTDCEADASNEWPVLMGGVFGRLDDVEVSKCNNYGTLNFDGQATMTQALVAGGLAAYSKASVSECNNEAAITANSSDKLAAVLVAGLTGYQEGMISNCVNKGALTMSAIAPGEAISILSPISKLYTAMGGIVAVAKNAEINTCDNHGALKAAFSAIEKASAGGGRDGIAGIVGAPWGTVKNCKNYGALDIAFKSADGKATSAKNHIPCVGGIAGCDFYSSAQSDANIEDCVNEGDIIYHNDCTKSNTTAGGIVGWPGAEGKTTSVTRNCVNKGDMTISGAGKGRIGSIHGGGGSMIGCTNYGHLTINNNSADSTFGGLTGYGAANNDMENCANYGDVIAKVKVLAIGGMCGASASQVFDWGHNCIIKCTVKAEVAGTWAAMLVGRTNDKDGKQMTLGTAATPIKVAGTLVRPNEDGSLTTTVMTAETMTKEYMFTDYCTHDKHSLAVELYTE
ncbi:MAG: hypothetical protein IJ348_05600 [Alistipes sp.]|nr:hypothetical protein [Alistipes sp.]